MKRIRTYNQFRESRVNEEFIGKLWRNITGKTRGRIETMTKMLNKIKDFATPITIQEVPYIRTEEGDEQLVKEVISEFNKIVEKGSWRQELASYLDEIIVDNSSGKKSTIKLIGSFLMGKPDFSDVEETDDSTFKYGMILSDSDVENIKNRLRSKRRELAENYLKQALTTISNREEFQNAKAKEGDISEPETKLLKYYSEVFDTVRDDSEPIDVKKKVEENNMNESISKILKSCVAFQNKPYKAGNYDKRNPEIYEESLGKDYIQNIDFIKKISDIENLKILKSELEEVVRWTKEAKLDLEKSKNSITRLKTLYKAFEDQFEEVGLDKFYIKSYNFNLARSQSFLNLVNYILENYGQMTIKEFFDPSNSKINNGELFTTSEDYFNGLEIYKVKQGSNKVYHGGKISPTDLDFLFREQGGMYAAKSMTAANNWPTILGTRDSGSYILSIGVTRRVYELTIKPGTKVIDKNPGGHDGGSKGGLKDENRHYTPLGIMAMANKWYMQTPDGQIPEDLESRYKGTTKTAKDNYFDYVGESEVVVFDRNVCDIRIVPFKELISEYDRLGVKDKNRKEIKNYYPMMRNLVWSVESQSPGVLSNLKEFTDIQSSNLQEIERLCRYLEYKKVEEVKAPDDQKVDDLVEKCGTISVDCPEIKKFATLLDYIIHKCGLMG